MKEVTDPELLNTLNQKEVTDPEILAQLEGSAPPPTEPTPTGHRRQMTPLERMLGVRELTNPGGDVKTFREEREGLAAQIPGGKYLTPQGRAELKGPFAPPGTVAERRPQTPLEKMLGVTDLTNYPLTPQGEKTPYGSLAGELSKAGEWAIGKAASDVGGIVGESPVAAKVRAIFTKKGKTAEDLLAKVGGEMKPSMAGEAAQEWMQIGSQEAKDYGNQLYSIMKDEATTVPINKYPNTWKTIDEIKSSRDYKMLKLEDRKHIDGIVNQVKAETSTPVQAGKARQFSPEQQADLEKQVVEQFGIPAPPEKSFDSAIGLKRTLSNQAWEARGTAKGKLIRDLKDSVMTDMEQAATDAGKPELIQSLGNADKFWSEQVLGEGRGGLIQKLQNMSPEMLTNKFRTGTLKEIRAINEMAGEEGKQYLKQGFVTDMISRNNSNAVKISNEARNLMAKRPQQMAEIFNPDELTILQNMANPGKVQAFMQTHPNTVWLIKALIKGGILGGSAGIGYKIGNIIMNPAHDFHILR